MYRVSMKADRECELLVYSLIDGQMGISARSVVEQIRGSNPSRIVMRINSDGGDVFEALAIHAYLKSLAVTKTVYIDGIAASSAGMLAMVGDEVIMSPQSMLMLHNPFSLVQGDGDTMRAEAEVLDKIRDNCASVYESKSGMSHEDVLQLMRRESWFTAQEALSMGFCDRIEGGNDTRSYDEGYKAGMEAARRMYDAGTLKGIQGTSMKTADVDALDRAVSMMNTMRGYMSNGR